MSENLENELENELMVLPPQPPPLPDPLLPDTLLPQIIVKGGKDIDGSWGSGKTFTREFYFELINVPVPVFMFSSFIPAYNSLHPYYPFAVAKDSKVSNQAETPRGRVITLSTNYEVIRPRKPLNEIIKECIDKKIDWTIDDVIAANGPFQLPAQDVTYEPIVVEETLDNLYVEKTAKELWNEEHVQDVPRDQIDRWKQIPFWTTAGTKLTGTRTRNILKMSFWYFADPRWFSEVDPPLDEAAIVTKYTGVVNDAPVVIDGRFYPTGTVKIESIEFSDMTWERQEVEHLSLKRINVVLHLDRKTWKKQYENVSNLFMAYPYVWDDANSGKAKTKMRINPETNQPYYWLKVEDVDNESEVETIFKSLMTQYLEIQAAIKEEFERLYGEGTFGNRKIAPFTPLEETVDKDCIKPSTESPDDDIEYNPSPQRIFCTMYDPNPKNEGDENDPIYVQDPKKAIQFFGTREDCFRLNPDSEPTEVSEPMYLDQNGFILYPDPNTGKVDTTLSPKIEGYVFTPKDFAPLHFPSI